MKRILRRRLTPLSRPDVVRGARRTFLQRLGTLVASVAALPLFSSVGRAQVAAAAQELRGTIAGNVVARGDESYEIWRQSMVWTALKPDRYPDLIVQPKTETEVAAAVKFARANGLKVAVRSSGHSWCHSGIRDGGMLIDLGAFREVSIDAETQTVAIGPAITGRELQQQLGQQGLAFPVAHCGTVGMGGYLLGGGQAWNGAVWGGRACFSIKAMDLINADGELIRVDDESHPEIMWAARGVGPAFFGIITRFHLQAYPLPKAITTSTYAWSLDRAVDASAWMVRMAETQPKHVESLAFLAAAPPEFAEQTAPHSKALYVAVTAFVDSTDEANAALQPFADGELNDVCLFKDEFGATPFEALFGMVDTSFPPERCAADTYWSDEPLNVLMEKLVAHFAEAPSPLTLVLCESHPQTHAYPDAAYSMDGNSFLAPYSMWVKPEDDAANLSWLRKAMALVEPYKKGHFISEADIVAEPSRAEQSFAPPNWQRIQILREKYDPHGVFYSYVGS